MYILHHAYIGAFPLFKDSAGGTRFICRIFKQKLTQTERVIRYFRHFNK